MEKHHPENLSYTKEHEWCRVDGDVATIGITWHAQDSLGDIVYCELPDAGEDVSAGQAFGVVESVKAVSDLYSPLTGTVTERNDAIIESPEGLNDDPYDDGWLIKVKIKDTSELDQLMTKQDYEKFIEESAE
ncbi:MAG TPA: glycine cleavage system protein GcvH [Myxococcales bacterium LLY-WYZ-16_1]|jgi:glycine cleavage system H protein|nr:glycine cleavage system protein GcvH [Myxococcales bacterium LLY-WYZ-16_1]